MSMPDLFESGGSFRSPSMEHAQVRDAMRYGVLTCPPETPLTTVARMLAHNHVHAIVVTRAETEAESEERAWGIVTGEAVVRGRHDPDGLTASGMATSDVVTVTPDDALETAAAGMLDHGASHAIVTEAETGRPIGMVSALDIAGVVAWGRG